MDRLVLLARGMGEHDGEIGMAHFGGSGVTTEQKANVQTAIAEMADRKARRLGFNDQCDMAIQSPGFQAALANQGRPHAMGGY